MNHVRKTVLTTSRAEGNEHTKEIATVMTHSLKIANTHYDIFEQEKASVVGAREIQSLFRGMSYSFSAILICIQLCKKQ